MSSIKSAPGVDGDPLLEFPTEVPTQPVARLDRPPSLAVPTPLQALRAPGKATQPFRIDSIVSVDDSTDLLFDIPLIDRPGTAWGATRISEADDAVGSFALAGMGLAPPSSVGTGRRSSGGRVLLAPTMIARGGEALSKAAISVDRQAKQAWDTTGAWSRETAARFGKRGRVLAAHTIALGAVASAKVTLGAGAFERAVISLQRQAVRAWGTTGAWSRDAAARCSRSLGVVAARTTIAVGAVATKAALGVETSAKTAASATAWATAAISAHRQAIRWSLTQLVSASVGGLVVFLLMPRAPAVATRGVEMSLASSVRAAEETPFVPDRIRPAPIPVPATRSTNPPAVDRVPPGGATTSKPQGRPAQSTRPTAARPLTASAPPAAAPAARRAARAETTRTSKPVQATASGRAQTPRVAGAGSPVAAYRGALVVRSSPEGAQVFVNGEAAGSTPLQLRDLPAGSRAVRVEMEGYERWSSAMRIVANQRTVAVAQLRPLPVR